MEQGSLANCPRKRNVYLEFRNWDGNGEGINAGCSQGDWCYIARIGMCREKLRQDREKKFIITRGQLAGEYVVVTGLSYDGRWTWTRVNSAGHGRLASMKEGYMVD